MPKATNPDMPSGAISELAADAIDIAVIERAANHDLNMHRMSSLKIGEKDVIGDR